jgi:hypothetical protein
VHGKKVDGTASADHDASRSTFQLSYLLNAPEGRKRRPEVARALNRALDRRWLRWYTTDMNIAWCSDVPRYGDPARVSDWLEKQLALCEDETFGQRFAASCPLPGLGSAAYLHRKLQVEGETLLVGIRFKGCDVAQPFVDLLAWTGEPNSAWIGAIEEAFASFAPRALRYRWLRATDPPWPGEVDQYLFAGPAKGAPHPSVTAASDLSWFDDFRNAFDRWREGSPLGPEVAPSDADELKECLDCGHVVIATEGDTFLGIAACLWREERAFAGWSIMEQFVIPEAQGRGLGSSLQRGLMLHLPPGDLVWGTIHGDNTASQKTAVRCGRELVETWWFVSLDVPGL